MLKINNKKIVQAQRAVLLTDCFGIVLNETLEILLCVFIGLKKDDVTFWKEVPDQEIVQTQENSDSIQSLDVLSTVKHIYSYEDGPGEGQ